LKITINDIARIYSLPSVTNVKLIFYVYLSTSGKIQRKITADRLTKMVWCCSELYNYTRV